MKAGKASKAGKATAMSGLRRVPLIGRPLAGAAKAAGGAAKAARGAARSATHTARGGAGGAALAAASAAGRGTKAIAKGAAKMSGKAAKVIAKRGAKLAVRGIQWLMANPIIGIPVILLSLIAGFIIVLGLFVGGQKFISSFGVLNVDEADMRQPVAGGSQGGIHPFEEPQAPHDDTASRMPVTDRRTGGDGLSLPRASWSTLFPAGQVEISVAGTTASPSVVRGGGEVISRAIPDEQRGLANIIEWMLPQWAAPYPVMVAEPPGITVAEETWPRGSGEKRKVLSCAWPDHEWAAPVPPSLTAGVPQQPSDVTIKGPWEPQEQHVCHLLAAAQVVWEAWDDHFGSDGFGGTVTIDETTVPVLDLTASRRIWIEKNSPPWSDDTYGDVAGRMASTITDLRTGGSPNRLWAWLTFAAFTQDGAPVSSQYDCGMAFSDLSMSWERMGEWAEAGGVLPQIQGPRMPTDFYASYNPGDLLIPWRCPRVPRAAAESGARGMWEPVVWAQDLGVFGPDGTKLVDSLGVSAAAIATMQSRGMDTDLAEEHGMYPKKSKEAYELQKSNLAPTFDLSWLDDRGKWDKHAQFPAGDLISWCAPDTRWINEAAEEQMVLAEPEQQPKPGVVNAFAAEEVLLGAKAQEADGLLAQAQAILAAIEAEIAALQQALTSADPHAVPGMLASIAQIDVERQHASEMIAAIADVVDYWVHADGQHLSRKNDLPGPTWQYECAHDSYMAAISSLSGLHGDALPDEASPLRALYADDGRGRTLLLYSDHEGASDSPTENVLRLAQIAGLLPEIRPTNDPMVSESCDLERWKRDECNLARADLRGGQVIVLPREWTDPRLPVVCPSVHSQSDELYESLLGHFASRWHTAHGGGMISVASFSSFHPCLKPDMEAAAWLAGAAGLPITGHGFRSFADSDKLALLTPLAVAGGKSRHNYGLALDFNWKPPACWPPPPHHENPCPQPSVGLAGVSELCGTEHRNGHRGRYQDFTTPANAGDGRHGASPDPIMMTNWCWQWLDWVTYRLSTWTDRLAAGEGMGHNGKGRGPDHQWRYPIVGLAPLSIEVWHWSYDAR